MITFQTQQESLGSQQMALHVLIQGTFDKLSPRTLEKQFEDYLKVGYLFVILDCSYIRFINSSGLQVMLKVAEMYRDAGGILAFVQVLPTVTKFFEMLGFTQLLVMFETQEEAIAYLRDKVWSMGATSVPSALPLSSASSMGNSMMEAKTTYVPEIKPASLGDSKPVHPTGGTRKMDLGTLSIPQGGAPSPSYTTTRKVSKVVSEPGKAVFATALSSTKKMPILETISWEMDMSIQMPSYMWLDSLFACDVMVSAMNVAKSKDQAFQITACFPGCLVVPASRFVTLLDGKKNTFWVTPLVSHKIQPWIEIGKRNEASQIFPMEIKIHRMKQSRWWYLFALFFLILAFVVPRLPLGSMAEPTLLTYACYGASAFVFLLGMIGDFRKSPEQFLTKKFLWEG